MKTKYGIWILTFIVIIISVVMIVIKYDEVQKLKLNEIADFIAVFVSTLVFIWLIFGYQQQATELNLQREELKNQVENTKKLVIQAELQAQANLELVQIEKKRIIEEFSRNIRPILVFYNTRKGRSNKNQWVVKNVGNSPAINVIISCASSKFDWIEKDTVLFPALTQNEIKVLSWTTKHGALVSIYSDIENSEFTTVCKDNKNSISKSNEYPDLQPGKYAYQLNKDEMNLGSSP